MIILKILGALAAFILLILLVPVTYFVHFERWKLSLRIGFLFGLWRKEKVLARHEDEKEDEGKGNSSNEMKPVEEVQEEQPMEPESFEESPVDELSEEEDWDDEESPAGPGAEETESSESEVQQKVSLWAQGRFALENGLAEELLTALSRLLSHSFPRHYRVEGALGLGDPMDTGMACGMVYALLPGAAQSIQWDYVERICTLKGTVRGRIIPLYVLYIALRLAVSKPAREFWHFRQGGNDNG